MVSLPSSEQATRLRELFHGADYRQQRLAEVLHTMVPPAATHHQMGELVQLTGRPDPFSCLARCFFLGAPIETELFAQALPPWFTTTCQDLGLVKADGPLLRPSVLLCPCEDLWIASDVNDQQHSPAGSEFVPPLSHPALTLLKFMIRRPVESMLDLCSGNALHGLVASSFSERVVASDLSARAKAYAEFNAALNGCDNMECVSGDLFVPLEDRRFDLVLCNPPFVLSPSTEFLYRDNAMDLDGFCRRVVREAPAHLNEGGICQIICEWVETSGHSWQARLQDWLEGTGCDGWVLEANRLLPSSYILDRGPEFKLGHPEADHQQRLRNWMDYFVDRQVEAIHGGLIMIRRRSGPNWTSFGTLSRDIPGPVGEAVRQGFALRDFLHTHADDDTLLTSRPRVAPAARVEQTSYLAEGGWRAESVVLRLASGIPVSIGIDENIRDVLARFDGTRSVEEVINEFASRLNVPPSVVQHDLLRVVRLLIEHVCLLP